MSTKEVDFNVLVAGVEDGKQDEAAGAFAKAFGLDKAVAQQIVKSAPIIFLTNASKAEVKALAPRLVDVSRSGIEFRITARPGTRIPKVNWPLRPQFAFGAGPADRGGSASFNLENNAFVCPGCGETFLFRKLGRLPLGEAPPEAPSAPPAPAAAKPSPARSAEAAARVPAPPKPAAKAAPAPPAVEEDDTLDLLDEPPGMPEEPSAPVPEPVGETAAIEAPLDDDLLPEEPVSLPESAAEEMPELPELPDTGEVLDVAEEEGEIPPPPPPPPPPPRRPPSPPRSRR